MVVDLIGGSTAEPGVRPETVEPRAVERQLVLEGGEAIRDQDQPPRTLGLDGSDAALDHRQAPILPQSSESMPNAPVTAPPPESLLDELRALVGNEAPRLLTRAPECSLEKSPNGSGRWH